MTTSKKQRGLLKINLNNLPHGYQLPLEIGSMVEDPHWNPDPWVVSGIYLFPNAQMEWEFPTGSHWVVLEYDSADLVRCTDSYKVPRGKILEVQESDSDNFDSKKLLSYFDVDRFSSTNALCWATEIGDRDIMIDFITDSGDAITWAIDFGDRDIMINRITDPAVVPEWAMMFGDHDVMKSKLTEPYHIQMWNTIFPNNPINGIQEPIVIDSTSKEDTITIKVTSGYGETFVKKHFPDHA